MKNWLPLFLIPLLLLSACSRRINPEKPVVISTPYSLDSLPLSEINIPVRISLKPFYAMAEKQVDTVFTSPDYPGGWVQDGCDTRYKYSFRRSPLRITASGLNMDLGFTGFYKITGSTRVCVAGAAISPWTAPCSCGIDEPERRVNVSFSNSFSLQPDYKIKLAITKNEPEALDKCEVCFWGQDITRQVLNGLSDELDAAKTELEKNYGTVNVRTHFQALWSQLSQPYNLYDMGWLNINPQRIHINSVYAKDDSLYAYLGLAARPQVSFEKPAPAGTRMPDMTGFSRQNGFSVFLDALLNYDSLSRLVNRYIAGKTFDFNKGPVKKKFIIKDCTLYGTNGDKLVIKVNFGGTDNGTFYLTGKPVYDRQTRMIEIKDIDFDIRSKDALLKTADWLFNRRIVNEIARYSRFDISPYADSARANVNAQLNRQLVSGVFSEGQMDDLSLIGIYPATQFLIIRSNCTGSLSLRVDEMDISL